jgi:hypothetical protein
MFGESWETKIHDDSRGGLEEIFISTEGKASERRLLSARYKSPKDDAHLDKLQCIGFLPPIACPKLTPLIVRRIGRDKFDLVDNIVDVWLELVLGDDLPVRVVGIVLRGYTVPNAEDGLRTQVFDPVEVFEKALHTRSVTGCKERVV